ncbi:MAG: type II secretion system protein [Tissierellia bacterium]|nr:type II secretion system protein [Tissierellia bacterium]
MKSIRKKGFSVIEILVGLAIMGLLMSIILPAIRKQFQIFQKEESKNSIVQEWTMAENMIRQEFLDADIVFSTSGLSKNINTLNCNVVIYHNDVKNKKDGKYVRYVIYDFKDKCIRRRSCSTNNYLSLPIVSRQVKLGEFQGYNPVLTNIKNVDTQLDGNVLTFFIEGEQGNKVEWKIFLRNYIKVQNI